MAIQRELHVRRHTCVIQETACVFSSLSDDVRYQDVEYHSPSHVKQEVIFRFRIVWGLCELDKLFDSENDCQRYAIKIDGLSACPVILRLLR